MLEFNGSLSEPKCSLTRCYLAQNTALLPMVAEVHLRGAMDGSFQPEEFLKELNEGAFDGNLNEVLRQLSIEQLEELVVLLAKRYRRVSEPEAQPRCR